jgi:ribosomal protein L27
METLPTPYLKQGDGVQIITSRTDQVPSVVRWLKEFRNDVEIHARDLERFAGASTSHAKGIMTASRALEEGRCLVDINQIMRQRNSQAWPALGIAHIGDRVVYCRNHPGGRVEFKTRHRDGTFFEVDTEAFHQGNDGWVERQATVPSLPHELREHRKSAKNKVIVWEASWVKEQRQRQINIDPALLEHIAGGLYAVVAVWDLSPVEAAILGPKVR